MLVGAVTAVGLAAEDLATGELAARGLLAEGSADAGVAARPGLEVSAMMILFEWQHKLQWGWLGFWKETAGTQVEQVRGHVSPNLKLGCAGL